MATMTPAVWVLSSDSRWGGAPTMRYPGIFDAAQQARLERLRQATLLFDGQHRQYFLAEDRSQFDFPFVKLASGRTQRMYSTCNALRLVSLKSADLLVGQEPLIRCSDDVQQTYIDELADRTALHNVLYGAALECSYQGETFLESMLLNGMAYVQVVPAAEIFPVGRVQPDGQYARYDRWELHNAGTESQPIWMALQTSYISGQINRQLWQLDAQNKTPSVNLDLQLWPLAAGLTESQQTGTTNTITWIPNLLQRGQAISDYDGVLDLQDALNSKQTQVSRVLSLHADPKLAAPESKADEQGNLPADASVYFYRTKEEIPQYITWQAELDAAMKDRAFALNQLLVLTETSPVLLGLKEGSAPDAYKKVRLEAFNSLTKAARKSLYWKSGIRRAVGVCLDLQLTVPGHRFDRVPLAVELRDGIPVDASEQAQTQATLRGAGLMSTEAALEERYGGDQAAVARELERISSERSAATPTVLMGESPTPSQDNITTDTGDLVDPATAAADAAA